MEEEGEEGEKLKDTEMENWRHKTINFRMSMVDTTVINENLDEVINKLDSVAKIIIASDLIFLMSKRKTSDLLRTQKILYLK